MGFGGAVGVVLLGLLLPKMASAQFVPDPEDVQHLRAARSVRCSFPRIAIGEWSAGSVRVVADTQEFVFQIDAIDHGARSARLIGNQSASDLTMVTGPLTMSFIEVVSSGAVITTTVYPWRDGVLGFRAVTARHVATVGPLPSQSYGHCRVWQ